MTVQVIGVDCSTSPEKSGIAFGRIEGQLLTITDAIACSKSQLPASIIIEQIRKCHCSMLLAVDAPLGWPASLGHSLHAHAAGMPLPEASDQMFRRETDRYIRRRLGQQSLDVGADRIARTAHAALAMIEEIRKATGKPIPLAWNPLALDSLSVIEVYPAATLRSLHLPHKGYKQSNHDDSAKARDTIVEYMVKASRLGIEKSVLMQNADVLDAAICVLAAADYLKGEAMAPDDIDLASKEGWIWTRAPS